MTQLSKKDQLDKLVDNGFISDDQKEKFEKYTQEDLNHLIEQSEVIKSLDAEKTEALQKIEEQSEVIDTLKKEKAEAVKKLEVFNTEVNAESVGKKVTPGIEFNFRGEKYKFKDTTPKSIKYGGVALTQKELVKDEDAILHLLTNSGLIEKL